MFLRIIFLSVLFFLNQGQTDSSQEKFDCNQENKDKQAYTYQFDATKIEKKIEPIKRLVGTGNGLVDVSDEPFLNAQVQEEQEKLEYAASQRDTSKCSFNKKEAQKDFEYIQKACGFDHIKKICVEAKEKAFEKTCGKKAPCNGGLYIEAINHAYSLTSKNLGLALEKRNEIAKTLIDFKKGYEKCANQVRIYIIDNTVEESDVYGDAKISNKNLCTDAYDIFINNKRKEMAAKNCSIRSIHDYVGGFIGMMGSNKGFSKKYQEIKNYHVMARVCTLKLLSAFNQLDKALDDFSPKRQTATSQEIPTN